MKKTMTALLLVASMAAGTGCKTVLDTWLNLTPEQLAEGEKRAHARRAGRAIKNVARDGCSCENK